MEKNANGKTIPVKVGLKPEIRDGWEYEFAINFNINQDHSAEATKDNTNMFIDVAPITEATGQQIYECSSTGIDPEEERESLIMDIEGLAQESDLQQQTLNRWIKQHGNLNNWTRQQLRAVKERLIKLGQQQRKTVTPKTRPAEHKSTSLDDLLAGAK
ncbi:hypothetical protein DS832_07880 [Bombilactobacillus bombi]|uniref:Uncharacterized protein n=1 Tax=Bombilactobacillus bombi TaxID=1303590 RepID=A0A3R6VFT8_9LACO|nr:hypothetical protein [Bombilactobacillus bombi]RHW45283.1 hypothetical protein DS832_07880 [Bombilactobacillus bombi]